MARALALLFISTLAVVSVGCVPAEQFQTVKMDRDQYATRLAVAEREKAEAQAATEAYKRQIDGFGTGGGQKDALILNQSNEINDLHRQLADLSERYAKAAANVGITVQLPQQLNDAIRQFADAHPELVAFDEARGVVKFKSDVTFAPGSAVLTSAAAGAIDQFAGILNSPAAIGYELRVVGHTDNKPIAHEATRAAGHKDNWYLSAHRAISVSEELRRESVAPSRLEVAGCADQHPIASNADERGRAQNRRVEVLILPTTVHSPVAAAEAPLAPAAIPAASRVVRTNELNKDLNKDAPVDVKKPVLNK